MATAFEVLFLGTGPEIDTAEGNGISENDGALVGMTFGSLTSPLASTAQMTMSAVSYSATAYEADNHFSNDTFSINGGPAQTFDGLGVYNATLTYTDGTTATITAVVIQDTEGNLYLAPERTANADYDAMTAKPIASLTLDSTTVVASGNLIADRQETNFLLCYASGTCILTPDGERPVEEFVPGSRVITADDGAQVVRWVRETCHQWPREAERSKPVRIARGALGAGLPHRDLIVSPQHRMLVPDADEPSGVLVPAKALVGLPGIDHENDRPEVRYVHLGCARHQVIFAEGAPSETFLPGAVGQGALGTMERVGLGQFDRVAPVPARVLKRPGQLLRAGPLAARIWTPERLRQAGIGAKIGGRVNERGAAQIV